MDADAVLAEYRRKAAAPPSFGGAGRRLASENARGAALSEVDDTMARMEARLTSLTAADEKPAKSARGRAEKRGVAAEGLTELARLEESARVTARKIVTLREQVESMRSALMAAGVEVDGCEGQEGAEGSGGAEAAAPSQATKAAVRVRPAAGRNAAPTSARELHDSAAKRAALLRRQQPASQATLAALERERGALEAALSAAGLPMPRLKSPAGAAPSACGGAPPCPSALLAQLRRIGEEAAAAAAPAAPRPGGSAEHVCQRATCWSTRRIPLPHRRGVRCRARHAVRRRPGKPRAGATAPPRSTRALARPWWLRSACTLHRPQAVRMRDGVVVAITDDPRGEAISLCCPYGLALLRTADFEAVAVAASGDNSVVLLHPKTLKRIAELPGSTGPEPVDPCGGLRNPIGVACCDDEVYVADQGNYRVAVYSIVGRTGGNRGRHGQPRFQFARQLGRRAPGPVPEAQRSSEEVAPATGVCHLSSSGFVQPPTGVAIVQGLLAVAEDGGRISLLSRQDGVARLAFDLPEGVADLMGGLSLCEERQMLLAAAKSTHELVSMDLVGGLWAAFSED